jgi:PAS domain S-box-containing protein
MDGKHKTKKQLIEELDILRKQIAGLRESENKRKQIEEELRQAEIKYRTLVEQIPAIIYIAALDENGSILYISPQVESLLGFSQAEWLADSNLWIKQLHPDDRERIVAEAQRSFVNGKPIIAEYRIRARDGRVFWFRDELVIIRNDAGQPLFSQGIMFDITKQKQVEQILQNAYDDLELRIQERTAELSKVNTRLKEQIIKRGQAEVALQKNHSLLQAIIEETTDAIYVKDLQGRYIMINTAGASFMGKSVEEVIDKDDTELFGPDTARQIREHDETVIATGITQTYEESATTKGVTRIFLSTKWTYRDQQGVVKGLIGISRDITERKRAEEKIRHQNEYLTALHETMLGLMNRLDLDDLLKAIIVRAGALVGTPHGSIYLVEPGESEIIRKVGVGICSSLIGHRLKPGEGAFGRVWQTGQPLVVEDYPNWPDRLRDPLSDAFRSVIGLPLKSGSKVIGIIGLNWLNKGQTFGEEEIMLLSRFAELASIVLDNARLFTMAQHELVERQRTEKALQYRVDLEKLIATLSTNFINLAPEEIDRGINRALRIIGEFAGVDRSYVFQFHDNKLKKSMTHEWCAKGVNPLAQRLKDLPVSDFAWGNEKIKRSEVVPIPCVSDLPPEATREKELLQSQGIQSLVCVPMAYGGSVVGFLGFDSVREEKTWSADILVLLKIAGEIFVNALERKRAEQALRESEEKYRTLFEGSQDGIFITTREGKTVDINQSALDLFGYTQEEMLALEVPQLHVHSQDWVKFQQKIESEGSVRNYEMKFRKKDGTEMECLLTATLRRARDRSILGYQGIIRDITEAKRFRQKAQQMEKLAALGELSSMIAHEIRNPLAAISLNFRYLSSKLNVPEGCKGIFNDIDLGIQRIQDIIKEILDFTRPALPNLKKENIHRVLDSSIRSVENVFQEANITIVKNYGNIPFDILMDASQIMQVFINLFLNAKQAMPIGGKLIIHTALRHAQGFVAQQGKKRIIAPQNNDSYPDFVEVQIEDTGKGISSKNIEKIFNPFFTTRLDGIGLGLAIVSRILEQHRAQIFVESKVGIGTKFVMLFPLK